MRKFVPKSNLARRGLAFKKHGKLRLSQGGRAVLHSRRLLRKLGIPRLIMAAKPTNQTRKVLFVCNAGLGCSIGAQKEFAELASKTQLNANLALNSAGASSWPKPELKRAILESDFVVSIGPFSVAECTSIVSKTKAKIKPKIIPFDVAAYDLSIFSITSEEMIRGVSKQALEAIRLSLEKEEKGK